MISSTTTIRSTQSTLLRPGGYNALLSLLIIHTGGKGGGEEGSYKKIMRRKMEEADTSEPLHSSP